MGTYEFLMFSREEQLEALADKSQLIMSKDGHGSYFELYALGLFFVEIEKEFFSDKILEVSIFTTGTKLDKYAGELAL
jgi:hypothetical protein